VRFRALWAIVLLLSGWGCAGKKQCYIDTSNRRPCPVRVSPDRVAELRRALPMVQVGPFSLTVRAWASMDFMPPIGFKGGNPPLNTRLQLIELQGAGISSRFDMDRCAVLFEGRGWETRIVYKRYGTNRKPHDMQIGYSKNGPSLPPSTFVDFVVRVRDLVTGKTYLIKVTDVRIDTTG